VRLGCAFVASVAILCQTQQYFPAGSLGATASQHQFRADWYSKHLIALREHSLLTQSREQTAGEIYRFLWLRTFHHPICVRLSIRRDGTAVLTSKETNGKGGYQPGKLIHTTTRELSKEEVRSLRERFDSVVSRQPPTKRDDASVGLDGAQWIFEASQMGSYRVVDRWSPPTGDPVHALGTMLLDMADFRLRRQDVY
jgi:hypothetical protein